MCHYEYVSVTPDHRPVVGTKQRNLITDNTITNFETVVGFEVLGKRTRKASAQPRAGDEEPKLYGEGEELRNHELDLSSLNSRQPAPSVQKQFQQAVSEPWQ